MQTIVWQDKWPLGPSAWEADGVAFWKQLLLSLCVAAVALFTAALVSPVAAAFLASHGFAVPLQVLGMTASEAPAEGAPPGPATQGARPGGRDQARKATVVLQPAGSAVINDRVTALGTGSALQSVVVLPKANGTLTEIAVASGAQVTAGGVDVADVDPDTLQSRRVPGLFLAGEVLDVDGDCGGFNLQWAWASGQVVGENAARMAG